MTNIADFRIESRCSPRQAYLPPPKSRTSSLDADRLLLLGGISAREATTSLCLLLAAARLLDVFLLQDAMFWRSKLLRFERRVKQLWAPRHCCEAGPSDAAESWEWVLVTALDLAVHDKARIEVLVTAYTMYGSYVASLAVWLSSTR